MFSGKQSLPSKEVMEAEISEARARRTQDLKLQYPYAHNQLMDMLAKELGILPDYNELKQTNPELYDMVWNK